MRITDRLRRAWLALTTPQVTDVEEGWWRELANMYESEAMRYRRDLASDTRNADVSEAEAAWRTSGRFRRILKMCTAQVIGNDLAISVEGDQRVLAFLNEMVDDPLNSVQGMMVRGVEGFFLRVVQMYQAALRDGDLFVTLNPDPVTGMVRLRHRPRSSIAFVRTDDEDWEREVWYAEHQEDEPSGDDQLQRERWSVTWDAVGAATVRTVEMMHFSNDRLDASTQGESLANTVWPWVQEYESMLRARRRMVDALARVQWMVDMPGADFQTRSRRKQVLEAMEWGSGGFVVTDENVEKWTPIDARLHGGDAAPDMESVRNESYIAGGIVPAWSGDGDIARAASRTVTPVALATLRVDQKQFFGFLEAVLTRSVQKWAAIRGHTLRTWDVSLTAADTTAYETLERARAFQQGVGATVEAVTAGLISIEEGTQLARRFAGLAEELTARPEGTQQINLSLVGAGDE